MALTTHPAEQLDSGTDNLSTLMSHNGFPSTPPLMTLRDEGAGHLVPTHICLDLQAVPGSARGSEGALHSQH